MKRAIALAAMVLNLSASGADAVERWSKVETKHFIVYAGMDSAIASRYARELEAFDSTADAILIPFSDSDIPDGEKTVFFLLPDIWDFSKVDPASTSHNDVGLRNVIMCPDDGREYFSAPLGRNARSDEASTLALFYHGLTVAKTNTLFSYKLPAWVKVGLNAYLSATEFRDGKAMVGSGYNNWWASAPADKPRFSYYELLTTPSLMTDADGAFTFESWVLVGHMLSTPALRDQFKDYLSRISGGEDSVTAFTTATHLTASDLARIYEHARTNAVPYLTLSVTVPGEDSVQVTRLPDEFTPIPLTYAALRSCPEADQGEDLLRTARDVIKRHPEEPLALNILARSEIGWGDPEAAKPPLSALLAKNPQDAEAQHLLGRLYLSLAQRGPADQRAAAYSQARVELGKAYNLDPVSAPILYHFAQAHADQADYPDDNTLESVALAQDYSGNAYNFYQAELFVRKGRNEDAAALLEPRLTLLNEDDAKVLSNLIQAIRERKPVEDLVNLIASYHDEFMP